jgi:hypothetical protein
MWGFERYRHRYSIGIDIGINSASIWIQHSMQVGCKQADSSLNGWLECASILKGMSLREVK